MKSLLIGLALVSSSVFAAAADIYSFKVKSIDDREVNLADYRGKTLLIVNTASKCGYTPQYEGLERLHEQYGKKGPRRDGLSVERLRRPGAGTAGRDQEILPGEIRRAVPALRQSPGFGAAKQPLYAYLTSAAPVTGEVSGTSRSSS